MKIHELFEDLPSVMEMSMLIDPVTNHALTDPTAHKYTFNQFIKYPNEIEPLTNEINVYYGENSKRGWVFAANPDKQEIYYLMRYEFDHALKLGYYVVQKWLWVDPKMRSTIGNLASKYFFKLIADNDTIVTDSEQTPDGRKFWVKRIKNAFEKGLNVYYYNFLTKELVKLTSSNDVDIFDQKYQIYTTEEHSLDKAYVITKKQL